MRRKLEKLLALVLLLALALFGGTARLRDSGAGAAEAPPVTATPDPIEAWNPDPDAPPLELNAPTYYTLHFIGDCTLATVPFYRGSDVSYEVVVGDDYAYPFAKTVEYFKDDDWTFANLECALTESNAAADKTFLFKAKAEYAKIMSEGSVEFVSLANNHTFDYGQKGYDDTVAALEAEGIEWIGRDEWRVYELRDGFRVGVYSEFYDHLDAVQRKMKALAAEDGVDFIIAAFHWGDEGSYQVNQDQIAKAHAAVDCGADFVYGSHPHTVQPVEIYNGVPIYYSFGNWTFGGNTNPPDTDTYFLEMVLARYPDGHAEIAELKNVPCSITSEPGRNNYQPVVLEEGSEAYERVLSKLDGSFAGQNLTVGYGLGKDD